MQKIPTLFKRDPEDMRRVLPEVTPGCEWVLAGEGVATRKYDGTCVMKVKGIDGRQWWARREVRPGKPPPPHFIPEETDPNTGKTVGWEPIEQSPFAKFHAEALAAGDGFEPGTYELCGPKINGNPEGFAGHRLIAHADAELLMLPGTALTAEEIRALIEINVASHHWEGIVWHHPDGRMAKLKVRDFPSPR